MVSPDELAKILGHRAGSGKPKEDGAEQGSDVTIGPRVRVLVDLHNTSAASDDMFPRARP